MATTPIPADMLKCLGRCDVPFGEFWMETDLSQGRVEPWERMFGKQASSAAHGYGSRLAAAEALTVVQEFTPQTWDTAIGARIWRARCLGAAGRADDAMAGVDALLEERLVRQDPDNVSTARQLLVPVGCSFRNRRFTGSGMRG